jgi:uncharacterized membrane protein YsdA (DUF1294 family)
MNLTDRFFLAWLAVTNVAAFLLFGFDKWRAGRPGVARVPEFRLALLAAIGGWPGGLLGMWVFRHKTAKRSFQLKFAAAFLVWAALLWVWWSFR